MPIFEYVCKQCQHEFEALVFGQQKAECPKCKSKKLDRSFRSSRCRVRAVLLRKARCQRAAAVLAVILVVLERALRKTLTDIRCFTQPTCDRRRSPRPKPAAILRLRSLRGRLYYLISPNVLSY